MIFLEVLIGIFVCIDVLAIFHFIGLLLNKFIFKDDGAGTPPVFAGLLSVIVVSTISYMVWGVGHFIVVFFTTSG